MRFSLVIALLLSTVAAAQTPPPEPPQPPKAEAQAPQLPPDTVVATLNGKDLTIEELESFVAALPPQLRQGWVNNRKAFVEQYALLRHLSEMAEEEGLDQKSPFKEALAYQRMEVLARAQINEVLDRTPVTAEQQQQHYEANQNNYTQAKVKVIYISYSATPPEETPADGTKPLTEAEAKAKADSILAKLRDGADFVELVKEHSEDPTSAEKDGDFGTIRLSDRIPEEIKKAIFGLQPGQVSEPVKQPNGFYLFRAEEIGTQPFDQVKNEIYEAVKQAQFQEWMAATQKELKIAFENEAFFAPPAPPPAPAAK